MSVGFGVVIPFVEHLGFTLAHFADGDSELHYAPRPEHVNSFEVLHGGASMTFLDVVMASAARSVRPESGVVTIEMKTTFMRPVRFKAGDTLRGIGRLLHGTRKTAFCEGRILDAQGQVCAHATGTFKYVPRQPRDSHHPGTIATD